MTTRREFLHLSAATAGAVATGVVGSAAQPVAAAAQPLSILILGGTGFIGPHQVRYALDRGHRLTLFNRGNRSGLYGDRLEELVGDRDRETGAGLSALEGDRTWDVVIDNSGYVPRHVRDTAELLEGRVGRYLYISTVAVYAEGERRRFTENGPLAPAPEPATEEVTWQTYGPLKAECDRIVREILGEACTVVRPTYIVGPGDTTDRFTYWVERVHRGGDVLAPSRPERVVQWVDVRDLCPWVMGLCERDVSGVFNAAGPASDVTREGLMWGLRAQTAAPVTFHWPADELLDELEISPPMLPTATGFGGEPAVYENSASMAAGLVYRPLTETVRATHDWWNELPPERREQPRRWISSEAERTAIARMTAADGKDAG